MAKPRQGLKARQAASQIVYLVMHDQLLLDEAFNQVTGDGKDDARDRALIRAISATALRRNGQIKDVLARFMNKPLARKFALATAIIETAAAQILFMNVPDHAAIDLAVAQLRGERKLHNLSGLANAVLRKLTARGRGIVKKQNAGILNVPQWMRTYWNRDFGKDVSRQIGSAVMNEAGLDITAKSDAGHWAEQLAGQLLPGGTIRLDDNTGSIEMLPGFDAGEWWVQDFAASLPVKILGDVNGLQVLDLCAAPGGKSAQLAAAGATVTCLDVSSKRLKRLRDNLARLKLEAEIITGDVLSYEPDELFDVVLLDAPCSATGTLRRHPDALHLKQPDDLDMLVQLQAEMLEKAAGFVRPGGRLVFATCSLFACEGEEQVARFVNGNDNFRRARAELAGLDHLFNNEGDLRALPHCPVGDSHGMDGFFASVMVKHPGGSF